VRIRGKREALSVPNMLLDATAKAPGTKATTTTTLIQPTRTAFAVGGTVQYVRYVCMVASTFDINTLC